MEYKTSDTRISDRMEVLTASKLIADQPISDSSAELVYKSRESISKILAKVDKRLIVIVGPCSIHDTEAAKDYANRLIEESKPLEDQLQIVMRVYFEKPRTTVGWKGLINDPDLDNSFKIDDKKLSSSNNE